MHSRNESRSLRTRCSDGVWVEGFLLNVGTGGDRVALCFWRWWRDCPGSLSLSLLPITGNCKGEVGEQVNSEGHSCYVPAKTEKERIEPEAFVLCSNSPSSFPLQVHRLLLSSEPLIIISLALPAPCCARTIKSQLLILQNCSFQLTYHIHLATSPGRYFTPWKSMNVTNYSPQPLQAIKYLPAHRLLLIKKK